MFSSGNTRPQTLYVFFVTHSHALSISLWSTERLYYESQKIWFEFWISFLDTEVAEVVILVEVRSLYHMHRQYRGWWWSCWQGLLKPCYSLYWLGWPGMIGASQGKFHITPREIGCCPFIMACGISWLAYILCRSQHIISCIMREVIKSRKFMYTLLLFQAPFTETDRKSLAPVEVCEVKVSAEVTNKQRGIKGALSGLFSSHVTDTALYDNAHVKVYSRAFIRPTEDCDILVDTRRTEINALPHTTAATTTRCHQRTKFPRLGRAWKAIKKLCCCCCGTKDSAWDDWCLNSKSFMLR